MGEDATLDAFLGTDESSEETASDGHEGNRVDARAEDTSDTDERPGDGGVEPATTTFAYEPSGESCEVCGATVERRWQQDGALVCEDCKDW